MIKSGLNVPTPPMPMPDFAVPNAAPMPVVELLRDKRQGSMLRQRTSKDHLHVPVSDKHMFEWHA